MQSVIQYDTPNKEIQAKEDYTLFLTFADGAKKV
jgi:hypothetical protein